MNFSNPVTDVTFIQGVKVVFIYLRCVKLFE